MRRKRVWREKKKNEGETQVQSEIKLVRPCGTTKVINVRQQRDSLAFPQVAFKKPTVIKADVCGTALLETG